MKNLNKKAPPAIIDEGITAAQVKEIMRRELEEEIEKFVNEPGNWKKDIKLFLQEWIEVWRRGVSAATEAHMKRFHSPAKRSVYSQEIDAYTLRIEVAEERLKELSGAFPAPTITTATLPSAGISAGSIQENVREVFENYLTERGVQILPRLKEKYTGSRPKELAILVVALKSKGLAKIDIDARKAAIHRMLKSIFLMRESVQALRTQLNIYNNAGMAQEDDLQTVKNYIDSLLSQIPTS